MVKMRNIHYFILESYIAVTIAILVNEYKGFLFPDRNYKQAFVIIYK